MSRDEERLPAPVLTTQQSGHDMMPIIRCLPFSDVMSNTDDFLVSATMTHMCIHGCIYMPICMWLFFPPWGHLWERKKSGHVCSLFNWWRCEQYLWLSFQPCSMIKYDPFLFISFERKMIKNMLIRGENWIISWTSITDQNIPIDWREYRIEAEK